MTEYILLFHGAVHDDRSMSAEAIQQRSAAWGEWIAILREEASFVGGTGFHDSVFRLEARDGEITEEEIDASDGLVGYVRVEVDDLDQLRRLCGRYPDWDLKGWIEIRQVSS